MEGRIGHLRSRYRVIGDPAATPLLAARLDRVTADELAEQYGAALDQALGIDPAVYVLRRVRSHLMVRDDTLPDGQLAGRWGEHLAGAVMRCLAAADDGENVVRFADQGEYVARFAVDLLAGTAWTRWYYGAFASLRPLDRNAALRRLLLEQRAHLAPVLAYLQRRNLLERVLAALDQPTLQALWPGALAPAPPDAWRPFVDVALHLLGRLGLHTPDAIDVDLLQAELAAGPQPVPDWRDRAALTMGVAAALRFLAARGGWRGDASLEVDGDALASRIDAALPMFDWLDTGVLRRVLLELAGAVPAPAPMLPVRRSTSAATPQQRAVLAALAALLGAGDIVLDPAASDPAANALRLYAALVASQPRWAEDAAATSVVRLIAVAWTWLRQAAAPAELLLGLRQGDLEHALVVLPAPQRAAGRTALQPVHGLGREAADVLAGAIDPDSKRPLADSFIDSEHAGVFLLARALIDARVAGLVHEVAYPPGVHHLVAALALRWCGAGAPAGASIDPAIGCLAGVTEPLDVDAVRAAWERSSAAHHFDFQRVLLRTMVAQRLCDGSILHLHRVALASGATALIGADASARVWPFARLLRSEDEVPDVLAQWREAWEDATGAPPVEVVADAAGDAGLQAALGAVDVGALGLPEADLSIALTAMNLLRVWGRWLRQFDSSSPLYVLAQFVRRPGRVWIEESAIHVELERRPLDIVLEMSGYTSPLDRVAWLGDRALRFHLRDG